jgi:hypothetical protein
MNRSSDKPTRTPRRQPRRASAIPKSLPFTERDRKLLGIGIGAIALGYIALSLPPVNGFLSLTIGPLLLFAGYCIVIPLSLLGKSIKS